MSFQDDLDLILNPPWDPARLRRFKAAFAEFLLAAPHARYVPFVILEEGVMRTKEELLGKLEELEEDPRADLSADVRTHPANALDQAEIRGKVSALKWVLTGAAVEDAPRVAPAIGDCNVEITVSADEDDPERMLDELKDLMWDGVTAALASLDAGGSLHGMLVEVIDQAYQIGAVAGSAAMRASIEEAVKR